jgi:hypothetical protein
VQTKYPRTAMTPTAAKIFRALRGPRTAVLLTLAVTGTMVAALGAFTASSAHAAADLVVQAEAYNAQSGALLEGTADTGGGQNVGWLANGDWMSYPGVELGTSGSVTANVRVASANAAGGTVELHADSLTGALLASWPIASTGGWQTWATKTASSMPMVTGKHTVFLALRSSQAADFVNINWFSIAGTDTSTPTPSMTSMSPAPDTGWVSVDPVKQAADTKAFFALTPKPITGNPVRVPEFHASCAANHHLSDDPIVFPNLAGASHNHTFFGNTTTDANSTLTSLNAGGTNCDPVEDKSAYWIPTLYANGQVVDPASTVTVYYASRLQDPSKTQPFPAGFRMIAGDAKQQTDTADHQGNHFWCAGTGGEVGRTADGVMPICAPTANLNYQLVFPDCWDGVHLDSPNHKAHVSNGVNGACPAAFPVPIPNLSYVIAYPVGMDTTHVTLASGTTFSMHGDFFNAWQDAAQAARVRDCIDQNVKWNAAGGF